MEKPRKHREWARTWTLTWRFQVFPTESQKPAHSLDLNYTSFQSQSVQFFFFFLPTIKMIFWRVHVDSHLGRLMFSHKYTLHQRSLLFQTVTWTVEDEGQTGGNEERSCQRVCVFWLCRRWGNQGHDKPAVTLYQSWVTQGQRVSVMWILNLSLPGSEE